MEYRICVYKDGKQKSFEDVAVGDIFQIKEPNGEFVTDLDGKTWFKVTSKYNFGTQGFSGEFLE